MKYSISHPHPHEGGVSDYHPLNKADIVYYLNIARQSRNASEVASIQVRLGQGIPGSMCPHDIDSPAYRKLAQLDEYFVKNYRTLSIEKMVEVLWNLMQPE